MPAEAGVRIGIKGFRQVMVAFQYYNPTRRQGYTDSSGMTLYYTPKLRRFDAGVSPLEVTHFSVPPGRESFEVVSACPGDCTVLQVASPIYIVLGMNHMHRLADNIKKFHELRLMPEGIYVCIENLNERSGIAQSFIDHKVCWHKYCNLKLNKTKLNRAEKRTSHERIDDKATSSKRKLDIAFLFSSQ
ncbi:DBH [Mytilus edulis]|uniref:DBH n=1 Tax=Mytilus edulis TaxID=6550 RepID=A0A8S3Q8D1_MYTED|nr:DBH [Mytilus edulis]